MATIFVHCNKVRFDADAVRQFNAVWPCSELRAERSYWFDFDNANGDLVDTDVPEQDDGGAAAALSGDAQTLLRDGTAPDWFSGDIVRGSMG